MRCKSCRGGIVASVNGKVSDLCTISIPSHDIEHDGCVPNNLNIGGGDYLDFDICLDCGQVQGSFPVDLGVFERLGEYRNGTC